MAFVSDTGDHGNPDDNWNRVFLAVEKPGVLFNEPDQLRGQKIVAIIAVVVLIVIVAAAVVGR